MKRVLVIAYYFPPMGMGGVQRTMKFARYLPEFEWDPIILTVKDVLYHARDESLLEEIRERKVIRTESLDPQRICWKLMRGEKKSAVTRSRQKRPSILEKINRNLLTWFLIPDPKVLWLPHVIFRAKRLIRSMDVDLVFTTSPPQSVHLAGLRLRKRTGLPWVADFRDNWLTKRYEDVPTSIHRRLNDRLVRRVVREADRIITVSQPTTGDLIQRSGRNDEHFSTLLNGFDRTDFEGIESRPRERFTITYSGALDPVRNPEVFLKGVARAVGTREEIRGKIRIRFVGSVYGIDLERMIHRNRLGDIVEVAGYVSHRKSIETLMSSDLLVLLVSEASGSDLIPGKIFEYLASGKPILAIVPRGEAATLILKHARGVVVPPEDEETIARHILRSFALWERGDLKVTVPRWDGMNEYERRFQTGVLAKIFDRVVCERSGKG